MSALHDEAVTGAGRRIQARANQFRACREADDPRAEHVGDEIVTRTAGFTQRGHVFVHRTEGESAVSIALSHNVHRHARPATKKRLSEFFTLGLGLEARDIPLTELK
jgi:hypothetical protein